MKVLIVDDHPLAREALRYILADVDKSITLLEAGDGQQAMQAISNHPDLSLILLDRCLPDRDGLSMLATLRDLYPALAVIMLSGILDRDNIAKALDLGAAGFLLKTGQRELIIGAIRLVLAGGIYVPPEIIAYRSDQTNALCPPSIKASPADIGLTSRQFDVLTLIMQGKSNKAICRVLSLAEPTVKNHVTAIFRALKVTNRTEAAISAREFGWSASLAREAQ